MTSLAGLVDRFTAALRMDGPHRAPDADERHEADALATALAAGRDVAPHAAALGFAVHEVAGRRVLAADPRTERSWGLVVLPAVEPTVVVEVPHPGSDLRTEQVGVAVLERCAGALYLQAGSHRRAGAPPDAHRHGDFPGDVAHRPDSVFAHLAAGLAAHRGLAQVQLHGFADRPGFDVVASAGAAAGSALLDETVRRLESAGEVVRRGGEPGCDDLSGVLNTQGRAAARHGTVFVHLELSRSVRRSARRRDGVAEAVAGAVVAAT
ncbi:hypothetical protein [Actinomycetospora termitidis]|uniref:Uncharacterized protein n=1 Tax=Actinomycetospora termitidis TaxID=3053470 RepID=A0ABT7M4S3_9PSEU|nr:hypothetical protein [Actinomycetospora sp. Odt1-22]MDL5155679.1 hypothetical protein [Actinomycetospora sp. Odt1-22]